jgi:toxin ParE1/3/4
VSRNKFSIRILRAAEDDLTEIITYIAADNLSAAERMAAKFEEAIALLVDNPFLGRIPDDETLIRLGYRLLVVADYLIFYTIEEHSVFVHRIIHGARDYPRLFE